MPTQRWHRNAPRHMLGPWFEEGGNEGTGNRDGIILKMILNLCGSMLGSTLQPRNRVLKAEPSRAQSRLHARRREHSRPDLESHAERRKRVDQPRHPQRTRRWLLGRWDLAKIGEHLEEYGVGEGQSQGSRSTRVRGCEGVRV